VHVAHPVPSVSVSHDARPESLLAELQKTGAFAADWDAPRGPSCRDVQWRCSANLGLPVTTLS
jgi:hypothetical protein